MVPNKYPAVELDLGHASVLLRGAIDRIDELHDGTLAIVDYKTGSPYKYGDDTGTYHGGRRLQHALYTHAVEQLLERPVTDAAYHFTSRKGRGDRVVYERDRLDRWPEILQELFDLIASGSFAPPFDEDPPCRICDFQLLCRVAEDAFGNIVSPPVDWARANNVMMPEYAPLQRLRRIDGEADSR